jgi:hypothetical protein
VASAGNQEGKVKKEVVTTLENEILVSARIVFNNPRLSHNDILEWSFANLQPLAGEIAHKLLGGITVCILKENDKREPKMEAPLEFQKRQRR